jgi:hypothetical protein
MELDYECLYGRKREYISSATEVALTTANCFEDFSPHGDGLV